MSRYNTSNSTGTKENIKESNLNEIKFSDIKEEKEEHLELNLREFERF